MSARGILDADMTTVGGWIAAGARAWIEELRGMAPAGFGAIMSRRETMLRFEPAGGVLDNPGAKRVRRGGRATIVIPRDLCLVRTLDLPNLGRGDLAKLLMLDRERIMPFTGGEAVVGGRIVGPRPQTHRAPVEVAGLPPPRARAVIDAIAVAGIVPIRVVVEPAPGDAGASIDLLPALREAGLIRGTHGRAGRWWAIVAFLCAVNLGASIWRDIAATDRLRQIVDAQQPAVFAARGISARIEHARRLAETVRAQRVRREPLALLATIGAALPAGAWVRRFAWEGDTVRLAGYRPADADVVGALRKAAGVRDIRSSSPEEVAGIPAGRPFEVTMSLGRR